MTSVISFFDPMSWSSICRLPHQTFARLNLKIKYFLENIHEVQSKDRMFHVKSFMRSNPEIGCPTWIICEVQSKDWISHLSHPNLVGIFIAEVWLFSTSFGQPWSFPCPHLATVIMASFGYISSLFGRKPWPHLDEIFDYIHIWPDFMTLFG